MQVTYNGVTFAVVKTNHLTFIPEKAPNGTTVLWLRVEIDVEGIMNPQAMSYAAGPTGSPGNLPAATVVAVRQALEVPRRTLILSDPTGLLGVSTNVITAPANGYETDLNNGPVPGPCTVHDFQGARTWFVRWRCTAYINDCGTASDPLISNSYSQSETIDDQFCSTRSTSGQAIFRTDILENTGRTADDFRFRVLPPVPLGFQRKRISVMVVPSRNALHYTCEDQQKKYDIGDSAASGSFITDVDFRFTLSSVITDAGIPGGQSLSHALVTVKGDTRASNWILTQRAFALAAGKIPLGSTTAGYVRQISITQVVSDRMVTLNVVYFNVPPANSPLGGLPVDSLRSDGAIPNFGGINPSPPWGKGTRGTANLKLLVAELETMCAGGSDPAPTTSGITGGSGYQDGPAPAISVTPVDQIPSFPTKYSARSQSGYNEYHIESRYRRRSGLMMAPMTPNPGYDQGVRPQNNAPTATFFRTSQPTTTLEVHFRAEALSKPTVPSPRNNNANLVLLSHEIATVSPQVMPDGNTMVWRVEGTYVYGLKSTIGLEDSLPTMITPWVAARFTDLAINNYEHGILDDDNGLGTSGSGTTGPNV